jgi:class 3 adenylate cyclase
MRRLQVPVGAAFLVLLAGWFFVRERPWLGVIMLVCAATAAGGVVIDVRRRRTPAAAIVFTDIVESTALISAVGDATWSDKLRAYELGVRAAAMAGRATVTKALGDGFLVVFVGPAAVDSAVACAIRVRALARVEGMETRGAVHVGECLLSRDDATGLAVHIAARAMAAATPGDVVVTDDARAALHDRVPLSDAGVHELRGVSEPQKLFRVTS